MGDSIKTLTDATVILGLIIVAIGSHAYFQSPWNKSIRTDEIAYLMCQEESEAYNKSCPNLSLETYFLTISFIAFIISLSFMIIRCYVVPNDTVKAVESHYKFLAGLLVFIGGITLIISTLQIYDFSSQDEGRNKGQYFDEKILAGALSLFNGIIYVTAATMGFKSVGRLPVIPK